MHVKIAKKTKGEVFEDLDMVSLLLGIPTTVVTHDKEEMVDLTHVTAPQEDEEDEEEKLYQRLLVTPGRPKGYKPSIQVIGSEEDQEVTPNTNVMDLDEPSEIMPAEFPPSIDAPSDDILGSDNDMDVAEEDFDWSLPQTVPKPYDEIQVFSVKYGFMDRYEGLFEMDRPDAVDIPDADALPEDARRKARLLTENAAFDCDHYIADFMDTDTIDHLIQYVPPWVHEYDMLIRMELDPATRPIELSPGVPVASQMRNDEIAVAWTDDHRNLLMQLPKKEFGEQMGEQSLLIGLVDLMFAYAYNMRTTEGENTVESAWAIVKLSSVLSWFDKLNTLQEALISSIRRSLIYPLYRNWALIQAILNDVYKLFYLGKRAILRALIEMKQLCDISESKHILSHLYLDDYCIWIQRVSRSRFSSLASHILTMVPLITKGEIGLPLLELESIALEDAAEKEGTPSVVEL